MHAAPTAVCIAHVQTLEQSLLAASEHHLVQTWVADAIAKQAARVAAVVAGIATDAAGQREDEAVSGNSGMYGGAAPITTESVMRHRLIRRLRPSC